MSDVMKSRIQCTAAVSFASITGLCVQLNVLYEPTTRLQNAHILLAE